MVEKPRVGAWSEELGKGRTEKWGNTWNVNKWSHLIIKNWFLLISEIQIKMIMRFCIDQVLIEPFREEPYQVPIRMAKIEKLN